MTIEKVKRERDLKQEIYQLEMKILDFKAGESPHPIDLPACEARLSALQKQLSELG